MTAPDTSPAAIASLLEGVTSGPWRATFDEATKILARDGSVAMLMYVNTKGRRDANQVGASARFIAAARELVPALSAERDRLAAQVAQLQRNEKLALAQVDRLLALTNKIDDDLQESRKYAEALVQELKDRAIKADVLRDAAQALGAMPEGYCFCSANRIGDDSKTHEPECADLRAALTALEKPHD